MTGARDDETLLAERLAAALAARDRGESPDLEALCAGHPELVPELAAALGMRPGLAALHDRATAAGDLRGRVLAGRYRLDAPLGHGAVGAVLRARDLELQRDVAVKLLHPGLFASPAAAARFRREAEVLAQNEHPNVLRIYDQGRTDDDSAFLVTELLCGVGLQQVLAAARQAMPAGPDAARFADLGWLRALLPDAALERSYLRQVVSWMLQVASGLAAVHARGVFHRDVKPSNLFVRDDGSAVLLDFGIAARDGDAAMTLPNAIVGTPCYMAPEQAAGRPEPRPTIDVYGLCATLYHLVTLQPPHEGDLQSVLVAVRTREPAPASVLCPGLPRDVQAILDRGLDPDLGRRYPTIEALAGDLAAFLDHRPVSVRPLGAVARLARRCRRRPARTAALVLGVAFLAVSVVALPLWSAVEARAASDERAALLAHLPGDLCIEGWPDERRLVPLVEREVVLGELDRLLALDPDDLAVLLLRAAERLDGGDRGGAAADFAELRGRSDSPYLRMVADRYRRLAEATSGADRELDLDLGDLPEPSTAVDHFVAGFHALRARDCERAEQLLTASADFVPARDLRLLASLGVARPDPEKLLTEAGWLEGHYGRPTARTRHVMAVAMLMLRRYDAAIDYCRQSLELRPDRHGPWNNLGLAYLRTGQLELARAACEKAVSFREWFPNSLANLAQVQRELGDCDAAAATLARIRDDAYREHELGNLMTARAIGAAGDDARRIALAQPAVTHFEAAAAAVAAGPTRHPRPAAIPAAIAYARALADPDRAIALLAFLERLRRDATNAQSLANLAGLLLDQPIDDRLRDELRLFLLEIATTLAPGKDVIRSGRDALRRALRGR